MKVLSDGGFAKGIHAWAPADSLCWMKTSAW